MSIGFNSVWSCKWLAAVAVLLTSGLTAHASQFDIVVPAYFFPNGSDPDADWARMGLAAQQVPLTAIVNPASGPGTGTVQAYVTAIPQVRNNGGKVIGYVPTTFGNRPFADVVADVNAYVSFYGAGNLDGIFFDEVNTTPSNLAYYQSLYSAVKAINPAYEVMNNPGLAVTDPAYLDGSTADRYMSYENFGTNYLGYVPPAIEDDYDREDFVNIAHSIDITGGASQALDQYFDEALSRNVGGLFFTEDLFPNPFDKLPDFWDDFVSRVAAINASGVLDTASPETLSNPVFNETMAADGSRNDFAGIASYSDDQDFGLAPGPEYDLSRMTIANDSTTVYLRLETAGASTSLSNDINIFLDTDQNPATGYIGDSAVSSLEDGFLDIGAEYLIRGSQLFSFQGATQDSFAFSLVGSLEHDDSLAGDFEFEVLLDDLGNPDAFDVITLAANSDVEDYLPGPSSGGSSGAFYRYVLGEVDAPTGDYNRDGEVDIDDYLLWVASFGSANLDADGNGDSVVDAADYVVWRDSYSLQNAASAAASGAPEPLGAWLVAGVLGLAGFVRRGVPSERLAGGRLP